MEILRLVHGDIHLDLGTCFRMWKAVCALLHMASKPSVAASFDKISATTFSCGLVTHKITVRP